MTGEIQKYNLSTELQQEIDSKVNNSSVYTKTEIDTKLGDLSKYDSVVILNTKSQFDPDNISASSLYVVLYDESNSNKTVFYDIVDNNLHRLDMGISEEITDVQQVYDIIDLLF